MCYTFLELVIEQLKEIINISVLVYDNADHTDDDTDSLDVSADTAHLPNAAHRMPRVEMVAPANSEGEKKDEIVQSKKVHFHLFLFLFIKINKILAT